MRSEWNKRRNSILMMCHHPYLGSASDLLKICFIQSEAISRSDQYGISGLISQKSFRGEIRGGVVKYRLLSGASMMFSALKVSKNCWKIKPFCELKSRNYEGSVNLVCNYSFFTDIDECKQDPCQNGASCKVNIMNWHHNIFSCSTSSTWVWQKIKPHQGFKKNFLAGQAILSAHVPMGI